MLLGGVGRVGRKVHHPARRCHGLFAPYRWATGKRACLSGHSWGFAMQLICVFEESVNQQLLRLVLKVNAGLLCPKSCIHIVSMLNPFWVSEFASGCTTIEWEGLQCPDGPRLPRPTSNEETATSALLGAGQKDGSISLTWGWVLAALKGYDIQIMS